VTLQVRADASSLPSRDGLALLLNSFGWGTVIQLPLPITSGLVVALYGSTLGLAIQKSRGTSLSINISIRLRDTFQPPWL
jgi:hypothetical protein